MVIVNSGKTIDGKICSFYIDANLRRALDMAMTRVKKKNWDYVSVVAGIPGCQPAGSKVLMANGNWKNIEEIKNGDVVLSPQNNKTVIKAKVKGVHSWFSKNNFAVIEKKSGRVLYKCSSNHELPFYDTFHKNKLRTIQKLEADRLNKFSRNTLRKRRCFSTFAIDNFGRKNCEIEPYCLGVFLGDGSFSSLKNSKGFVSRGLIITSSDVKMMKAISKFYPIMNSYNKINTCTKSYRFSLNGAFSKLLSKYGLEGKRSGEKFIPKEAMLSDLNYRKKLLAGLIDTDGYYNKEKGVYELVTKSKKLSENYRDLIFSLGYRASIRKIKKSIKKINFTGTYYAISFCLRECLPLIERKKYIKRKHWQNEPNTFTIDFKKSKSEKVYGFEVESGSHNYITDNWMVTGNSGKSTFARVIARYCCPWFSAKDIAFTDDEFIRITNEVPNFSSVILDESFQSLNSRMTMTPQFLRIVNHLQIIRQKHLFIILCLPNFFDLSKGVAIFRASHLFLTYANAEGDRGRFLGWGRDEKRKLYVEGSKYMNYNCVRANIRGRYTKAQIISEKLYEDMKMEHLQAQQKKISPKTELKNVRDELIYKLRKDFGFKATQLEKLTGLSPRQLTRINKSTEKHAEFNQNLNE